MTARPFSLERFDVGLAACPSYGSSLPRASPAGSSTETAMRRLLVVDGAEPRPELVTRARLVAHETGAQCLDVRGRRDDAIVLANMSDLIIVSRNAGLAGLISRLGLSARRLLRRTRTPMLVVGAKPRGAYRRVLVAADLRTDMSRAFATMKKIAGSASITLLHAYHGLLEGKLEWAGVPARDVMKHRLAAQRKAASGMTRLLCKHELEPAPRALLTHDFAVPGVLRRAREVDADLVVVVRSGWSWWAEALGASVSLEIASNAHCDVLVTHAHGASDAVR